MPSSRDVSRDLQLQGLQHELNQLREEGLTKRRRNQGELLHLQQSHDHLREKWRKASQKRPLHAYIKAVTSEQHLVPSKILSKQAKMAQSLHLMEVYLQQKSLIENQQRQYAQLLCTQAAQQEELASDISLAIMNDLCQADGELRELKEKMREIGMTVSDSDEAESDRDDEAGDDSSLQQNLSSSEKTVPTDNTQQQESSSFWWWPIHHGDEKKKAPGTTATDDCNKSVASESSVLSMNPMSLLWMPPKFKQEASPINNGSQHTIPSVKSDLSNEKAKLSFWGGGNGDASVTHDDSEDDSEESDSLGSYQKPVARQWWPSKVTEPQQAPQQQEESTPEEPQHWWESFYR